MPPFLPLDAARGLEAVFEPFLDLDLDLDLALDVALDVRLEDRERDASAGLLPPRPRLRPANNFALSSAAAGSTTAARLSPPCNDLVACAELEACADLA